MIVDAWIDEKISPGEAMEKMLIGRIIEFTPREAAPPQPRDLADEAWEFVREGFARMNREKDARRGLVLSQ